MTEERKSENALRKPRVDVVIPTYKPGKKFSRLLKWRYKKQGNAVQQGRHCSVHDR